MTNIAHQHWQFLVCIHCFDSIRTRWMIFDYSEFILPCLKFQYSGIGDITLLLCEIETVILQQILERFIRRVEKIAGIINITYTFILISGNVLKLLSLPDCAVKECCNQITRQRCYVLLNLIEFKLHILISSENDILLLMVVPSNHCHNQYRSMRMSH